MSVKNQFIFSTGDCKLSCPKKSVSTGELATDCLESSCCRDWGVRKARSNEGILQDMAVLAKL